VSEEADKTLSILDPLPDALNDADAWRWSGGFFLAKGDALRDRGQDGAVSYKRARQVLLRCISICIAHDRQSAAAVVAAEPEAYRLLSAVYLRLGDIGQAAEAADRARSLDPLNPDAYRQTARVLVGKGDRESAAVMLTQGIFLTADEDLRQDLLALYRSGLDSQGCAVRPGPDGPTISPGCELVHRHICAASVNVVRARLQKGQKELAESQKRIFIANFGCPAAALDEALRD
jgi:tetratricopeptide (TPR) repeat protein